MMLSIRTQAVLDFADLTLEKAMELSQETLTSLPNSSISVANEIHGHRDNKPNNMFKDLSTKEETEFRDWAWANPDKKDSSLYHPICRQEMAVRDTVDSLVHNVLDGIAPDVKTEDAVAWMDELNDALEVHANTTKEQVALGVFRAKLSREEQRNFILRITKQYFPDDDSN
jgi:hypothetical protein